MLCLITGVPGSGKTLLAVQQMVDYHDAGRPLFVHGVRNLTIPHEVISCGSDSCEFCPGKEGNQIKDFREWAPPSAVIVLDEVQEQFRNRPAGSRVPEAVMGMEKHRHGGIDFLLITQSPALLDQNIRKLVTVHHHIKAVPMGRVRYTWSECNDNPKSGYQNAVKESWRLKKKYFQYYKSAEVHTKMNVPIPKAVYMLVLVVIATGVGWWKVKANIEEQIAGTGSSVEFVEVGEGDGVVQAQSFRSSAPAQDDPLRKLDLKPQISNIPESAPAYVNLVTVQDYPRRVGCVANQTRCLCYTQQGTIYPTTVQECRIHVGRQSPFFNPYLSPDRPTVQRAAVPVQASPGQEADSVSTQ